MQPNYQIGIRNNVYKPTFKQLIDDFEIRTEKNEEKLVILTSFVFRNNVNIEACQSIVQKYCVLLNAGDIESAAEQLMCEEQLFSQSSTTF